MQRKNLINLIFVLEFPAAPYAVLTKKMQLRKKSQNKRMFFSFDPLLTPFPFVAMTSVGPWMSSFSSPNFLFLFLKQQKTYLMMESVVRIRALMVFDKKEIIWGKWREKRILKAEREGKTTTSGLEDSMSKSGMRL